MSFQIKSIGHAFAVAIQDLHTGVKAVENFVTKLSSNPAAQATIETITGAVAGPAAVEIERAVFAIAGEVGHVLMSADAALTAKLVDAGLDSQVLTDFKSLLSNAKIDLQNVKL